MVLRDTGSRVPCYWLEADREGGGMDGSGEFPVGSVLRERLGSRNQPLVESLCKWREKLAKSQLIIL